MYISWQCITCRHITQYCCWGYITLNSEDMNNYPWLLVQYFMSSTHLLLTKSILFSTHPPSRSACVRQLSGLLPVQLHERTGGSTFLLNIALHSGDSLPSLPLPSLCFCPFLYCTVPSNWSRGLHFIPGILLLVCFFLCLVITERMHVFVCAEMQQAVLFRTHGIS